MACAAADLEGKKLLFATGQALVKIVPGEEFITANRTVSATKLADGDQVICVRTALDEGDVVLQTENGIFLRFSIEEIPLLKKNSRGVRGIRLAKDDLLEAVYFTGMETMIRYKDKEVHLNRLKNGKRDGKGIGR